MLVRVTRARARGYYGLAQIRVTSRFAFRVERANTGAYARCRERGRHARRNRRRIRFIRFSIISERFAAVPSRGTTEITTQRNENVPACRSGALFSEHITNIKYTILTPRSVFLIRAARITLFQLENQKCIFSVRYETKIRPMGPYSGRTQRTLNAPF